MSNQESRKDFWSKVSSGMIIGGLCILAISYIMDKREQKRKQNRTAKAKANTTNTKEPNQPIEHDHKTQEPNQLVKDENNVVESVIQSDHEKQSEEQSQPTTKEKEIKDVKPKEETKIEKEIKDVKKTEVTEEEKEMNSSDSDSDNWIEPNEWKPPKQYDPKTINDVVIFNLFSDSHIKSKPNLKNKMTIIENSTISKYAYEPEPFIIFSSQILWALPGVRIFLQRIPESLYCGCINKSDSELYNKKVLTKRKGENKIVYHNWGSRGFSGTSDLGSGNFFISDNSNCGYKTIKKFQEGFVSGDTLIMKYNKKENKFQFCKQMYKNYGTDKMDIVYETNKIKPNYHYFIGCQHSKSMKMREFSFAITALPQFD